MPELVCSCGVTIHNTDHPPIRCSCGVVHGVKKPISGSLFPAIGAEIKQAVGCGCENVPFKKWDAKGVRWCRDNQKEVADSLAQSGWGVKAIKRIVGHATRPRVSLVIPSLESWKGPARGGLFKKCLVESGFNAKFLRPDQIGKSETRLWDCDVVVNHAMVCDIKVIRSAAEQNPGTQFVNLNHSAIAHVERSATHYAKGFLDSLTLARDLPNCWYASQEKVGETLGQAAGIERCIWLPTPGHRICERARKTPSEKPVLVIAGRRDPIKNNLAQIVACGLLKGRCRLVLCMDRAPAVQRILDEVGVDHEWRGLLPHGEWIEFLRDEADVLLCCSLAESFGYAAAEAMQSGVPVVASESIRFADPDLVAKTGEPASIASRIERALSGYRERSRKAFYLGRAAIDTQNSEYILRIGRIAGSPQPISDIGQQPHRSPAEVSEESNDNQREAR